MPRRLSGKESIWSRHFLSKSWFARITTLCGGCKILQTLSIGGFELIFELNSCSLGLDYWAVWRCHFFTLAWILHGDWRYVRSHWSQYEFFTTCLVHQRVQRLLHFSCRLHS
jgi:hypothetical protein